MYFFTDKNMKKILLLAAAALLLAACGNKGAEKAETADPMDNILVKNLHPVNINNIPQTFVEKAKFPVIDMHSHDYAANEAEIDEWVKTMDRCGIERTQVMHCSWIGEEFDKAVEKYSKYPDRFQIWCCFDYTEVLQGKGCDYAIAQLERAHEMGAVGVGELGDKGDGDLYAAPVEGRGIHLDDPRIKPILEKCAELKMPINIHVAEPYWMYLPLDEHNDGLPNAGNWHIDTTQVELGYWGLVKSFENAVRENPNTIFIACHYLNMNQDYPYLSQLLDKYPNLYLDIAARVAEAAQTPRATRDFIMKYQDRLLFGTDNGMSAGMYQIIFRTLETEDEHFYPNDISYIWPLSGFYLPDSVLEKIYRTNALRILNEYK